MGDQCAAPQLDIVWMCTDKTHLSAVESHIMGHKLFGRHKAADNFGHDQLPILF